ncbi:MAG: preprotein translocase subunit SecG [Deltaproteobacteria bacterium]|nr:preprotein translocase subunit SecG [Deltaproteobacteria bacterium]
MTVFLSIIHVIVCLGIIFTVLLQSGKGTEIGAAFGGSSQTVFGSSGATPFLGKVTAWVAIIFMITSMSLALIATKHSATSVMSKYQDAKGPAPTKEDAKSKPGPETAPGSPAKVDSAQVPVAPGAVQVPPVLPMKSSAAEVPAKKAEPKGTVPNPASPKAPAKNPAAVPSGPGDAKK